MKGFGPMAKNNRLLAPGCPAVLVVTGGTGA
jgi:hypothetical protein